MYWVYYKPPILSYFGVGMYAPLFSFSAFLALFRYSQPTNTYIGVLELFMVVLNPNWEE